MQEYPMLKCQKSKVLPLLCSPELEYIFNLTDPIDHLFDYDELFSSVFLRD